jgi:hypothetical protein
MFAKGLDRPPANDNAGPADQRPRVTVPAGRPERAYAQQGNLILPLRFARLLPGWAVPPGAPPDERGGARPEARVVVSTPGRPTAARGRPLAPPARRVVGLRVRVLDGRRRARAHRGPASR